jgi:hypothetical protein
VAVGTAPAVERVPVVDPAAGPVVRAPVAPVAPVAGADHLAGPAVVGAVAIRKICSHS